jgi:hypothetical protein
LDLRFEPQILCSFAIYVMSAFCFLELFLCA